MKIIAFLPSTYSKDWTHPVIPTISLPDSAIVKNGNPVYLPDFDSSFSALPYFAIKINRLGKNIAPRFAERYYSEAAPVLLLRGNETFSMLIKNGLPWNSAFAFDKSVVIGEFTSYSGLEEEDSISISVNGNKISNLPVPLPDIVNNAVYRISVYNSLKMGDLILIPVESQPLLLTIDSMVTVSENENLLLKLPVK